MTKLLLWLIILLVVGLALSFPFLARKLAEKSGWRKLAELYGSDVSRRTVKGIRLPVRSLLLGDFPYQNSVRVIVTKKGMLLGMVWPFSYTHTNVLIPWRAIRETGDSGSPMGKTKVFSIGQPEITTLGFRKKDWETLRPHLRGKGIS